MRSGFALVAGFVSAVSIFASVQAGAHESYASATFQSMRKTDPVRYMHLEAVAWQLFGDHDISTMEVRSTIAASPQSGYKMAMTSVVSAYSPVTRDNQWVTCTTQFAKDSYGEDKVAKTDCQ